MRVVGGVFDKVPAGFALCLKSECASAGECLRGLAGRDLGKERISLTVVNPLLADTAGEQACRFFRKAEKVRVAYGFKQAMAQVPAGHVKSVRSAICGLVCQRNYYYLLRGEKPMFPEMQKKIASILTRYGLPAPVTFDRYDWLYEW